MRPIKYQENPTMATKKFSPAQIAAQKLFAERARAGTLGNGKRKANPEPYNPYASRNMLEEYAGKTDAQLRYIIKDAGAAAMAQRGMQSEMKYLDQVNDANTVLYRRSKGLNEITGGRLKTNPDKAKPRAYVKRASQITGAPPSKRLVSRRKMALSAPAGYFPNPKAAMMTGYQVICMHPKKHVVGIFKTMAEAKMVARAMADAKGVPYAVKTVKVHKSHFAV